MCCSGLWAAAAGQLPGSCTAAAATYLSAAPHARTPMHSPPCLAWLPPAPCPLALLRHGGFGHYMLGMDLEDIRLENIFSDHHILTNFLSFLGARGVSAQEQDTQLLRWSQMQQYLINLPSTSVQVSGCCWCAAAGQLQGSFQQGWQAWGPSGAGGAGMHASPCTIPDPLPPLSAVPPCACPPPQVKQACRLGLQLVKQLREEVGQLKKKQKGSRIAETEELPVIGEWLTWQESFTTQVSGWLHVHATCPAPAQHLPSSWPAGLAGLRAQRGRRRRHALEFLTP